MLTVCMDANVYISAIAFGGKSYKVVEFALAREFYLITSSALLSEVKRNLIAKLDFTETAIGRLLDEIYL